MHLWADTSAKTFSASRDVKFESSSLVTRDLRDLQRLTLVSQGMKTNVRKFILFGRTRPLITAAKSKSYFRSLGRRSNAPTELFSFEREKKFVFRLVKPAQTERRISEKKNQLMYFWNEAESAICSLHTRFVSPQLETLRWRKSFSSARKTNFLFGESKAQLEIDKLTRSAVCS